MVPPSSPVTDAADGALLGRPGAHPPSSQCPEYAERPGTGDQHPDNAMPQPRASGGGIDRTDGGKFFFSRLQNQGSAGCQRIRIHRQVRFAVTGFPGADPVSARMSQTQEVSQLVDQHCDKAVFCRSTLGVRAGAPVEVHGVELDVRLCDPCLRSARRGRLLTKLCHSVKSPIVAGRADLFEIRAPTSRPHHENVAPIGLDLRSRVHQARSNSKLRARRLPGADRSTRGLEQLTAVGSPAGARGSAAASRTLAT